MANREGGQLRRVGAMWKPKPNQKSKGSGSVTINGLKQRFLVFTNDRKRNDRDPDWILMSSDEPEADNYERGGGQRQQRQPGDDDI